MTWFAFQGMNGGKAVNLAGSQEKQAVAEGFHGYATEAEAESKPNTVNLVTKYFADAWIADYKAAVAEQAQPGGKNASNPVAAGVAGAEAGAAAAAKGAAKVAVNIPGLSGVTGFLTGLTSANLWYRVLKVAGGAILLIVGLVKLTRAEKSAPGLVRKAVAVAPLL